MKKRIVNKDADETMKRLNREQRITTDPKKKEEIQQRRKELAEKLGRKRHGGSQPNK